MKTKREVVSWSNRTTIPYHGPEITNVVLSTFKIIECDVTTSPEDKLQISSRTLSREIIFWPRKYVRFVILALESVLLSGKKIYED